VCSFPSLLLSYFYLYVSFLLCFVVRASHPFFCCDKKPSRNVFEASRHSINLSDFQVIMGKLAVGQ
jgi:hypothetical protein